MKDLIILTDKPITYDSISSIIKTEFKNYQLLNDDTHLIYVKKRGSGFELELTPNDKLNDPNCMMDDTVDKCPNKEAYLTNLNYTSTDIAKRIIKLLNKNIYIPMDDTESLNVSVAASIIMYKLR